MAEQSGIARKEKEIVVKGKGPEIENEDDIPEKYKNLIGKMVKRAVRRIRV